MYKRSIFEASGSFFLEEQQKTALEFNYSSLSFLYIRFFNTQRLSNYSEMGRLESSLKQNREEIAFASKILLNKRMP